MRDALVAEFRDRFERLRPPPVAKTAQQRSDWYRAIGAIHSAIREAKAIGDADLAAALEAVYETARERETRLWRERDERTRKHEDEDWSAALGCEMRAESVRGLDAKTCIQQRVCFLCGSALPGRRQRWCSDACVRTWHESHAWGWARDAALARDGNRCVRCGAGPTATCGQCGQTWPCGDEGHERRTWDRRVVPLEVNHVIPRVGRGYHDGCHNHQDNLESLCHSCHVAETTAQIRSRIPPPEPKPEPEPGIWDSVA